MPSLLSIPHEVKHDILKCLNFNQLFSVQHVNKYFKNFVRQYKDDLAKKKFDELGLFYVDNKNNIKDFKLVEPFKFELSQQLEKKWKCAIEDSIPTFLCAFTGMDDYKVEVICLVDALQNKNFYFQLPKIPKSIEEMKIVFCFLQQLFACCFEIIYMNNNVIFNPKLLQILFEEKKELVSKKIKFSLAGSLQDENFSSFALNHLISDQFFVQLPSDNIRRNINIAFNILANGGNKFSKVVYRSYWALFTRARPNFPVLPMYQNLPNIYNMIIENIETSKNLSKMVKKINLLGIAESDIGHQLPEKAENIEENVQLGTKKFQLSNKYNPKMKFSICQKQNTTEGGIDIEVEKIN